MSILHLQSQGERGIHTVTEASETINKDKAHLLHRLNGKLRNLGIGFNFNKQDRTSTLQLEEHGRALAVVVQESEYNGQKPGGERRDSQAQQGFNVGQQVNNDVITNERFKGFVAAATPVWPATKG